MPITKTGMCQDIQIQRLLQNPATIIREQGQVNLLLQLKVANKPVPHPGQKALFIKLLPGVSLAVAIVLPVRVQVAKATGLQDHPVVPQDLHIVLQDHQVAPLDHQLDHQDHQAGPQDPRPDQVAQDLPVQEEKNKSAC